jgi:polyisoprenoid-binding protein YceI
VNRRIVIPAVVAAVAVAAGLIWYFSGDEPAEVSIERAAGQVDEPSAEPDPTVTATSLEAEGTWTVDTSLRDYSFTDSQGTFIGFRIDEELATIGAATAVGRTPAVTGTIRLDGTTITEATVTADLSELATDQSRRDNRAREALGVPEHAETTFTLTEPIDLGAVPAVGATVAATAVGDLTVNGVTNQVAVPLEAVLAGDGTLVVTGSFEVALTDHDIDAPSAPIVLGVADTATVELQLYLSKSGA